YTLANRELTPILYDSIVLEYLACGYIVVVDQHKQGVYTAGGKKLSDAIYDRCFMLDAPSEGKNFILVPVKRQYDCQMIGQLGNTYVKIRQDGSTRPFPADSIPEKENWNLLESSDASTFYRRDIEDMIRRGKINASYTKIHLDQLVDNDYSGGYYRILIENPAGLALYDLQLNKVVSEYYEDLVKVVRFRNGQELRFVKKKGKYGVVSAAGTQVYPFEYDGFGTISSSEAITIKKGGKGAIVFSTIYPPISCRYEEIEHFKNLPVNSRWSFALFKVVKAGKPGFVGENGVEYFK
ncbi:MAG: hypothetical protein ABIQ93_16485, partial [Saprospiraceae bacterium]